MEDSYDIIIYLVVVAIGLIFNYLKKRNKGKSSSPAEDSPVNIPTSVEEVLGKYLNPVTNNWKSGMSKEMVEEIPVGTVEEQEYEKPPNIDLPPKNMEKEGQKSVMKKTTAHKPAEKQESDETTIAFNLKEAVIYSEILNRKVF